MEGSSSDPLDVKIDWLAQKVKCLPSLSEEETSKVVRTLAECLPSGRLQPWEGQDETGRILSLLKQAGPAAVTPLISILNEWWGKVPHQRALVIVQVLFESRDSRAYEQLLTLLEAPMGRGFESAQETVVRLLGRTGDLQVAAALARNLHHYGEWVRAAAVGVLGEMREREAVEPLIALLADNEFSGYDWSHKIADALGSIGDERAIMPLLQTFRREGGNADTLHKSARTALAHIGDAALEPLVEALHDSHWRVRSAAATVLGDIGDKRAVEPLLAFLKRCAESEEYYDSWGFAAAVEALGKLRDERAIKPLAEYVKNESVSLKHQAAKALGVMGGQGENALDALLSDANDLTRVAAAYGLSRSQTARAVRVLSKMLRVRNAEAQKEAARTLGEIDGAGTQALIAALEAKEPDVRRVVAWALGGAGRLEARSALESLRNDSDPEVREAVRKAIIELAYSSNPDVL